MSGDPGVARAAPPVTVSLVTYNGLAWLPGCIASIDSQLLDGIELLVLDNGSRDGTLAWLRENLSPAARASLIELPRNVGYAAGHNRNIGRARAELVCLLNQDVVLDEGFLQAAVGAFERDSRVGSVQGRIRRLEAPGRPSRLLDTTGLEMRRDRRVVSRLQGRPDGPSAATAGAIWGVDGPAPVYRAAALREAAIEGPTGWEVLDEDFFAYKEDVDLAWRLRRLGWIARYEPDALAWHGRGAGGQGAATLLDIARANRALPRSVAILSWRNQRLMQLKNDSFGALVRDLPYVAARELLSLAHMLVIDPRRLVAMAQLLVRTPRALHKRRQIAARVRRAERLRKGSGGLVSP